MHQKYIRIFIGKWGKSFRVGRVCDKKWYCRSWFSDIHKNSEQNAAGKR